MEVVQCLQAAGGQDIVVILDHPTERRMGGATGLVVVTGRTVAQLRVMAQALVQQLRWRQLDECNVVGAQFGPEGADGDSTWLVVDCRNYVVHLQDAHTRAAIDLEGLWGSSSTSTKQTNRDDLFSLNALDENAVDEYVANNPVPADYNAATTSSLFTDTPWMQLQNNRWTSPHRPVVPVKARGGKRSSKTKRRPR